MNLSWYLSRLAAMGPQEIVHRVVDRVHEAEWKRRYFAGGELPVAILPERRFIGGLARARAGDAPQIPRDNLLRIADRLLAGEWRTFAITRTDVTAGVDWHLDPKTGMRAPGAIYAFDIPFVGGASAFDTKYVWELSRHHQTTVLAVAFWLTGDERYARAAVEQIESWVRANPFLAGIHWASGIELGIRLIAFAWTRRLLEDWPEAPAHFENNDSFARSVVQHQWLLANRRSHGSSANNHLIYEMAGLYISACCMPWQARSERQRNSTARILEAEFARQIFPEGYTRELASDYNGFVLEAVLLCLVEGALTGAPLDARLEDCAHRMLEWLSANSDCRGQPPRQGDSDDATGLLLDAPDYDRWQDLSYLREAWSGHTPASAPTLRGWLLTPLLQQTNASSPRNCGPTAPQTPRDSGLIILRARRGTPSEIWCAFDAGPLGYLSIAAHGHADALAVELRYGGAPIFVDPGTYVYAGQWRDWFRSTAAHNTVELGGVSQSESGGPFLWTRHAHAALLEREGLDESANVARIVGEHDGYQAQPFAGRHRRTVTLDRQNAVLTIRDELAAAKPVPFRMFYHLHPDIGCTLTGNIAELACGGAVIRLSLPGALSWRLARGSDTPGPGWFSPSFDVKTPAIALIGEGMLPGALTLETMVKFPDF
ncbi:MAG TPA: alginate lyase family protein [Rhizomicrobium sp.]|jgi:hypothetical protein